MYKITHRDERNLKMCYPRFGERVRAWLEKCHEEEIPVHITQSHRFYGEQDELFRLGKSPVKGGESLHNFFLAVDFGFDNSENEGLQDPYTEPFEGAWKKAAIIARGMGLVSGFFWDHQDRPHLQAKIKTSTHELHRIFLKLDREGLYDYLDKNEEFI